MTPKSIALSALLLALAGTHVQAQACPTQGLIQSAGHGTPGTTGTPVLDSAGVPLTGKALLLELSQGLPGGTGLVLGGLNKVRLPVPKFGATLYLAPPWFQQTFFLDSAGDSGPLFELPVVPDLCGVDLLAQAFVLDPAATGGVAFSQALRLRFGGPATGPLYGPVQGFSVSDSPASAAIGDLDGDGVLDLAVGTGADVSILLGLGDGSFAAALSVAAGSGPGHVALGDFDGDARLDLAAANRFSDSVSVLLGLGDGTFGPAQSYAVGGGPAALVVGDLDGDGRLDLAASNYDTDDISVLLGLGDGSFAPALNYTAGDAPGFLVVEDLDGDDDLDLVTANQLSDDLSVLLGLGDGTFAAAQSLATGVTPLSVAAGDLDGDGVPELVVVSWNAPWWTATVLLGQGDGTFVTGQELPVGDIPLMVEVQDLDADGLRDVALAISGSTQLSVLLGHGDGTLAAPQDFQAGDNPQFVAIGDLDDDGTPDLVTGAYSLVSVLLNQLLQ